MAKISIFPFIAKKIKKCLGIVEDTDIAEHTIALGKYVVWKGNLCKSSEAIPEGTALSSSNLTDVPDGGLNELNSNITQIKTSPTKVTVSINQSLTAREQGCYYMKMADGKIRLVFCLMGLTAGTNHHIATLPSDIAPVHGWSYGITGSDSVSVGFDKGHFGYIEAGTGKVYGRSTSTYCNLIFEYYKNE